MVDGGGESQLTAAQFEGFSNSNRIPLFSRDQDLVDASAGRIVQIEQHADRASRISRAPAASYLVAHQTQVRDCLHRITSMTTRASEGDRKPVPPLPRTQRRTRNPQQIADLLNSQPTVQLIRIVLA